ncbi:transcriptional activator protein acu-15 [Purpureocillium lavendulum]|uniref:Transcriptional activator protein acu-15 n=1 Tax=Purpureocillium lavendulum TaxID=1247861 RepID=A0AB34FP29_9HYPO|nr:transcriptional activator protein acu-15 [Purpureocillium lavendulum]
MASISSFVRLHCSFFFTFSHRAMADEKEPLLRRDAAAMADTDSYYVSSRDASRRIPQTIAHRGHKAAFAENSMAAFRGAARVGAHAIETDVRLTADGVAVISHDASLKRCFGVDKTVAECDWAYLSTLRMLRDKDQGMPRLADFFAWLVSGPGRNGGGEDDEEARSRERLWVLLDIKIDDDPRQLMRGIATALSQTPAGAVPWEQRILLGCWNAALVEAATKTLPGFPLAHIGASLSYARHFLAVPGLAFNMAQAPLLAPLRGRAFMRAVRAHGRALFVWTVNTERGMEWCIRQNLPPPRRPARRPGCASDDSGGGGGGGGGGTGDDNRDPKALAAAATATVSGPRLIDGVITDDPELFLAVCRRYEDQLDGTTRPTRPATARETVGLVMHVLGRQLLFKLMFVYRRFWLNKLDYLHERERAPVDKTD